MDKIQRNGKIEMCELEVGSVPFNSSILVFYIFVKLNYLFVKSLDQHLPGMSFGDIEVVEWDR